MEASTWLDLKNIEGGEPRQVVTSNFLLRCRCGHRLRFNFCCCTAFPFSFTPCIVLKRNSFFKHCSRGMACRRHGFSVLNPDPAHCPQRTKTSGYGERLVRAFSLAVRRFMNSRLEISPIFGTRPQPESASIDYCPGSRGWFDGFFPAMRPGASFREAVPPQDYVALSETNRNVWPR